MGLWTWLAALVIIASLFNGCASRYVMDMNNGERYVLKGKPRFDKQRNSYFCKTVDGREGWVSAMKVRAIAPSSEVEQSKFKSALSR